MAASSGKESPRANLNPSSKQPWNPNFGGPSSQTAGSQSSLNRIRTLMRNARVKAEEGGAFLTKQLNHVKKADEAQFWKEMFNKYDLDSSGGLSYDEIETMVREDLKLGKRAISDLELREFFHTIDLNGDQDVDWGEWLDFVSQGKLKDMRPVGQVLEEVGRAVRGALRRNGIMPQQVEEHIRAHPEFASCEEIDLDLFKRILRKAMDVGRHDCSDDNLRKSYESLVGGGSMQFNQVVDFIHITCLNQTQKEIGFNKTFPGLIGGMGGTRSLPEREPNMRPGTFPFGGTVSGPTAIPFCLSGRKLPPLGRISVIVTDSARAPWRRRHLRPVVSCPDLVSREAEKMQLSPKALEALQAAEVAEQASNPDEPVDRSPRSFSHLSSSSPQARGGRRPKPLFVDAQEVFPSPPASPTGVSMPAMETPAPTSPLEIALAAAQSAKDDVLADPFAAFKASAASATTETPVDNGAEGKRSSGESKRKALANEGSYRVIFGKEALNRVEQRLLEAGVDVRGGYHRTKHK